MNNKGFAITTILYGTLILFLMLLVSMLGILATYKDRLSLLIDSNNGARSIINGDWENILYGDIDLDGDVDDQDAEVLQNYVSGSVTLSEEALRNADVNLDGEITEDDALLILYHFMQPDIYPTLPYIEN